MTSYLLGIASSRELTNIDTIDSYWCVPGDTKIGHIILLYCPRSASAARQGIFAQCVVTTDPSDNNADNSICYGYEIGCQSLRHVSIKIDKRFRSAVTAKDMKRDPILSTVGFVRKNFQGTTFKMALTAYQRIIYLSEKKANTEHLESSKDFHIQKQKLTLKTVKKPQESPGTDLTDLLLKLSGRAG